MRKGVSMRCSFRFCLFGLAVCAVLSSAQAQEPARLFRDAPSERPLTDKTFLIEKGYGKILEAADTLAGAGESRHDEFSQQRSRPRKKPVAKKIEKETVFAGPGYLYPPDDAYPPPVIAYDAFDASDTQSAPAAAVVVPNPNRDYEELRRPQNGNRRELNDYEKTIIFNQRPVY